MKLIFNIFPINKFVLLYNNIIYNFCIFTIFVKYKIHQQINSEYNYKNS